MQYKVRYVHLKLHHERIAVQNEVRLKLSNLKHAVQFCELHSSEFLCADWNYINKGEGQRNEQHGEIQIKSIIECSVDEALARLDFTCKQWLKTLHVISDAFNHAFDLPQNRVIKCSGLFDGIL